MTDIVKAEAPTSEEMESAVEQAALMQRVETLEGTIADLREKLARYEERKHYMTAEEMYIRARQWKGMNKRAWEFIKSDARRHVQENTRFSMQRAIENLRNQSGLVITSEEYRVCNAYAAVLARFLVREMPELRSHIVLNRSKVDKFFPDVPTGKDTD